MEFNNFIRYLVILISITIFCYQINIAWETLLSTPTVDKTDYIPVTKQKVKDLPIITLCPRQTIDVKELEEMGYDDDEPDQAQNQTSQQTIQNLKLNSTSDLKERRKQPYKGPASKKELLYFMKGDSRFFFLPK